MSTQPVESPVASQEKRPLNKRLLLMGAIAATVLLAIIVLSFNSAAPGAAQSGSRALVLAIPAFLAGILSFLSPCTLPILPAYFAFTFQAQRQNITLMSVAFLMGLATSLTLLGATATALGNLIFDNRDALTFWGGLIVIAFGIMGMLGKGFGGPQIQERPVASLTGSYLYGATFALSWTPCVGPILGSLLMMATASGVAVFQGGILAFIYAMGLGVPLILLATFFSRLGTGSRFWRVIRGRGFEVNLGSRTLYLHTTSVISGLLMVLVGVLLASGRLETIAQWTSSSPLSLWVVDLESLIGRLFGVY